MSRDPISQTPVQMSLLEDSPVSRSATQESSAPKTTPDISGRKCLDLSGNAGPLGLLEKMLLESSSWAWTKYSLTWRAKATPQGRLIFQLARLAPRTSANGSGLLHTPTAKANQMAPSMAMRDKGSWGLMWPTPNARENGGGEYQDPEKIRARMAKGYQANLGDIVKLWPTPRVSMANGPPAKEIAQGNPKRRLETEVELWQTPVADDSVDRAKGKWNSRGEPKLSAQVKLWPTPTKQDASNNGGPSQHKRNSLPLNTAVLYPTLSDTERPRTRMEKSRDSGQGRKSADTRQSKVLRQEDGACSSEGLAASGDRPEVWWKVEPPVGRVVDGLSNRVPQLRALGNSIIPQIAQEIGNAIKALEK